MAGPTPSQPSGANPQAAAAAAAAVPPGVVAAAGAAPLPLAEGVVAAPAVQCSEFALHQPSRAADN